MAGLNELNVASATNDDLRRILMVYDIDEKEVKGLERNHLISRIEKILASQEEGQLQNAPAAPAASAKEVEVKVKPKIERAGIVQRVKKASAAPAVTAPAVTALAVAPAAALAVAPAAALAVAPAAALAVAPAAAAHAVAAPAAAHAVAAAPSAPAAVENCGGVLSATFLQVSGNGNCLYAGVLQGLERHPCGNLITKTLFYSSVDALRKYVVTDPIFTECFGNMYDILNSTSIEHLRVLADTESGMNDMYPWWTINWIIEEKENKKENKKVPSKQVFIDEAIRRVSTTSEYATACEVSIIRSEIEKKGISVNIVTSRVQDNGTRIDPLPATVDFGTTENPIITLLYNGRNHYDALIHIASSRGGKSKKSKRSKKGKTSKRSKRSKRKTKKVKKIKRN